MAQHIPPCRQQFGDNIGRHAALGDLYRGFDHREGEPFDAKAVVGDVAPLCLKQPVHQAVAVGVIGKKFREFDLCQSKEAFVVP